MEQWHESERLGQLSLQKSGDFIGDKMKKTDEYVGMFFQILLPSSFEVSIGFPFLLYLFILLLQCLILVVCSPLWSKTIPIQI